jgi:PPK2 family polyphosphate:nucleotide phosphotransferase
MAKSFAAQFRIEAGHRAHLGRRDPRDLKPFPDRAAAEEQSLRDVVAIDQLQMRLYAERTRSLLVILQGMDTSGKDGTVRHVFKEVSPLGTSVTAFKKPSDEELAHDFLWRAHMVTPRRGYIGIFNRSHYEDVLIGRVRKLARKAELDARYDQINAFEKLLVETGTTILKFMLNISKKEQGERLQERLDKPDHRWKFNPGDLEERKLWARYMAAYERVLDRCSTDWAPWYVIPSDHKWARNAAVAGIVREKLEEMNPRFPKPDWKPSQYAIK